MYLDSKSSGGHDGWLKSILDTAPVGCSIASQGGVLEYVNQRLADTFGTATTELFSKNALEVYRDPGDRIAVLDIVERDGFVRDFVVSLRKTDGTPVWTLLSLRPAEFNGRPAIFGWTHDITKQKLAEDRFSPLEGLSFRTFRTAILPLVDGMSTVGFVPCQQTRIHGQSDSI